MNLEHRLCLIEHILSLWDWKSPRGGELAKPENYNSKSKLDPLISG
jgi:hypothetical protein